MCIRIFRRQILEVINNLITHSELRHEKNKRKTQNRTEKQYCQSNTPRGECQHLSETGASVHLRLQIASGILCFIASCFKSAWRNCCGGTQRREHADRNQLGQAPAYYFAAFVMVTSTLARHPKTISCKDLIQRLLSFFKQISTEMT